jgi:ATP-dependent Lon protease
LGEPIFVSDKPFHGIGVVTGLAWTTLGGETLQIEATRVHTKSRGFNLTGQLGEVMQESANIAYSYIMANIEKYGGDESFLEESTVHLHVPDGSTPKDGPSAGITMATALVSLVTNKSIRRPLAMTGELSLTGHVLPIGGVREKTIAARRQKIKELIFPEANRKDFDELPVYIRKGLKPHFVSRYSEVAAIVFGK